MGSGAVEVPMSQEKSALKLDKAVVGSAPPAAASQDENCARLASDACVAAVTATAVTATAAMLHQAPAAVEALKPQTKTLCLASMRRCLVDMEYAVRGVIVDKAEELRKQLACSPQEFPNIPEIIPANIGNPQAVGQQPLTFNRQVIACMICPFLRAQQIGSSGDPSSSGAPAGFPKDVIERASRYATGVPAIGAYSHSQGALVFRQEVAKWFEARDGYCCDPQTIFLTDGASAGIRLCLEALIGSPKDGILIPVPQYPLYKATITRLDGQAIPYYLDEDKGWALTAKELKRAVDAARKHGIAARALAVINPGNPTGSLLSRAEIEEIVRFCERERLVILADEVYQENVYGENAKFVSFRQVMKELNSHAEVISFHSSSKGLGGECGFRGGLMQLENIDAAAVGILYKLSSVSLCSNLLGQAMMASILNPPKEGDASHATDSAERHAIFTSLQRKARYVSEALNSMPGVSCQPIEGAMYAFPRLTLPPRAIEAAKEQQIAPDMLYCMKMLNETGVICVPGSGFEQYPGTYHYRLTILPEEAKFPGMLDRIRAFHLRFMEQYA